MGERQKKKEEAKIKEQLAKQQAKSMKQAPKSIWHSGNNNMSFVADNANNKNNSGQSNQTQQTHTGGAGSYPPPVLPAIPPVSHAEQRSRAEMYRSNNPSGLYVKDMEPYDRYSQPYHDAKYDDRYEKSVANGQKLTLLRNALGLSDFNPITNLNNTLSSYHTNNSQKHKPLVENVELVQSSSDSTQNSNPNSKQEQESKSTHHTTVDVAMVEPNFSQDDDFDVGPGPIRLDVGNGGTPRESSRLQSTVRSVEVPGEMDSERTPGIMLSDVRLNNAPYTSSDPNQTYNTVSVHSSNEKETTPDSKKIDIRTVGGVPSIGPAFERLMSEVKDKQNVNRNISERILSNEFEPIASSQNINPQISLKSAVESGQSYSQRVGSVQHSHHPSDDTVKIHTSRSGTNSRNNNTENRQSMWSEPELKDVPVTDV